MFKSNNIINSVKKNGKFCADLFNVKQAKKDNAKKVALILNENNLQVYNDLVKDFEDSVESTITKGQFTRSIFQNGDHTEAIEQFKNLFDDNFKITTKPVRVGSNWEGKVYMSTEIVVKW